MRTTFHLASGSIGFISISAAIAALVGCSASNASPPSSNGGQTNSNSGGQTNSSNGGQTNSSSGGQTSSSNGGTSSSSMGGSTSSGNGGNTSSSNGGSGGGSSSNGGTTSTAGNSSTGGSGGGAVMCTNTDKSVLPINSTGWVDKTCNTCGIQGAFYWYGDPNTSATLKCGGVACSMMKPPYQAGAPGPGMCISGTTTGNKADYGAGIGFGLNESGGMTSVKSVFDATKAACGNITGFDITLTGNTNGIPIRVGFKISDNEKAISPFIPVGDPAGMPLTLSGSSQIVIKNAAIPADWMSTDPSPADPTHLYDLQVALATDSAPAGKAFEMCITNIKPVIDGGSGGGGGGTGCKANSVGTISSNTGVQALGSNYGYQNNVNNLGSGSQSVTGYYGSSCAAMTVTTSNISAPGGSNAPASYPSIVSGWHWGSWNGSYTKANAKAVSALTSVMSNWSYTPPAGQKWDVAYDMWVASSKDINAPDSNTLEVMVWLDYSTATTTNPIGSKVGTFSAANTSWEVWYGPTGSWHTVSYRRTPSSAAVSNFDLAPFLKDALTHQSGSGSWNLLSVQAGFELFTATSGGSIDSYSLTIN